MRFVQQNFKNIFTMDPVLVNDMQTPPIPTQKEPFFVTKDAQCSDRSLCIDDFFLCDS